MMEKRTSPSTTSIAACLLGTLLLVACNGPGADAIECTGQLPAGWDANLPSVLIAGGEERSAAVYKFDQGLYNLLNDDDYSTWAHDQQDYRWTVHGWIRIFYSPPACEWLKANTNRDGSRKVPSSPMPEGAVIVKVQYDDEESAKKGDIGWWTTMTKDSPMSPDGWYWSIHFPGTPPDPPITTLDPQTTAASAALPPTVFGKSDCVNCHGSTVSASTYIDAANILGGGPTPPASVPRTAIDSPHRKAPTLPVDSQKFDNEPRLDFAKVYGFSSVPALTDVRTLPGEGLDHVPAGPEATNPHFGTSDYFLTSDQCIGCHDATYNTGSLMKESQKYPVYQPNMLFPQYPPSDGNEQPEWLKNDNIVNLSPYAEAHASVMGLAGRDPIMLSQVEYEGVVHPTHKATIEDTCFSCHGVMGERQLKRDKGADALFKKEYLYAHDGEYAKYGALARDGISCTVCHHIEITKHGLEFAETFTGKFDVGPANQIYGPFDESEYVAKDPDDNLTIPMRNTLGAVPVQSPAMPDGELMLQSSKLCGSCHTVFLPVYAADGTQVGMTYEQATYLEWLNSDYNYEDPYRPGGGETARTCQDCHMPSTFHAGDAADAELEAKIANTEDNSYFQVFPMPTQLENLDLPVRPLARHAFLGINLFVMEMYRQFLALPKDETNSNNYILGVRTQDPETVGNAQAPLDIALDTAVDQAREISATIEIASASMDSRKLAAAVEVTNLTGHHFPSGVGFRRAFVELAVRDAGGNLLWVSGGTDGFGQIQGPRGTLPTEYFRGPVGKPTGYGQFYQPHHQTITRRDQVQIYEELVLSPEHRFTTSFLSLEDHIKDNRLQPKGWQVFGPNVELWCAWTQHTAPEGAAQSDPDYVYDSSWDRNVCKAGGPPGTHSRSTGADRVVYEIPLSDLGGKTPASVTATLYYQAIPPYYLAERFSLLTKWRKANPSAPWSDAPYPEALRLLYMTSSLDTSAKVGDDAPIANWRILVGSDKAILTR